MQFSLGAIDYAVLGVYFVFVIAIGWLLRRRVQSSQDFLTSRHSVPLWITSLATRPRTEEEMRGLVMGLTDIPRRARAVVQTSRRAGAAHARPGQPYMRA